MGARIIADRSLLLSLWLQHPDWSNPTLAQATGRSVAWVKKWKARFRAAPHPEEEVWGRSQLPAPRARFSAAVVAQVLQIRDEPPEHLHRTPGPKAILYYLARTASLEGEQLPRSTRTIWKILCTADRIARRPRGEHQSSERPDPLVELQLDFKDVVQIDPLVSAKQAHAVEVFDAVDVGTSLWLMGEPSASSTAETVFGPLITLLQRIGLPERVRFDRDPRWLGGTGMHDFPAPFLRFWYALGVQPVVNPPHRPDLNAFVERLRQHTGARVSPADPAQLTRGNPREPAALPAALQHRTATSGALVPQSATSPRFSPAAATAASSRSGGSRSVATGLSWAMFCPAREGERLGAIG